MPGSQKLASGIAMPLGRSSNRQALVVRPRDSKVLSISEGVLLSIMLRIARKALFIEAHNLLVPIETLPPFILLILLFLGERWFGLRILCPSYFSSSPWLPLPILKPLGMVRIGFVRPLLVYLVEMQLMTMLVKEYLSILRGAAANILT